MPRIKPTKKYMTRKRNLKAVRDERREMLIEQDGCVLCEGCGKNGTQGPIEYSHHVGEGKDSTLSTDPDNGAYMCRKCHAKVEARELDGLKNEAVVREFIQIHDPASLEKKELQKELQQLRKDNLAA